MNACQNIVKLYAISTFDWGTCSLILVKSIHINISQKIKISNRMAKAATTKPISRPS